MAYNNRIFIQKATKVQHTSAIMAYRLGTSLIKKINEREQSDDNVVRMHYEQLPILERYFDLLHKGTKTQPSCKSNCSGCCKYPIWTSAVESMYISNWIRTNMDQDTLEQIHENFDTWYEEIGEWAEGYKYGDKIKHDEYTRKNIKCPFLINNSCSIYDARPIVCRTYFSYGNPKNCERELFPKGTLNLTCAGKNLYEVPMANKMRKASNGDKEKENQLFPKVFGKRLLPYWFYKLPAK
ncbi:YkgJ family cysteine cluster protein [Psychrobacillus sp. FJAT-51614]|uniref:YkgJ family cysteine cluster protein n=1 Tax=Psychrobacillus mangrovi TaxID=3117745 RepID=A0ABU8F8T7_9BACI